MNAVMSACMTAHDRHGHGQTDHARGHDRESWTRIFSVARVSHDDNAKLNRDRRRSVMGGIQASKGMGRGGVAVVGNRG